MESLKIAYVICEFVFQIFCLVLAVFCIVYVPVAGYYVAAFLVALMFLSGHGAGLRFDKWGDF